MLDPKFYINHDDMRRLHRLMTEPSPSRAPLASINCWGIVINDDGTLRTEGVMSGDDIFGKAAVVTGPIWQLNMPKRLIRTSKAWVTLQRGYHEGVAADVEIEAVGPYGDYIAPCVANRYLELVFDALNFELDNT